MPNNRRLVPAPVWITAAIVVIVGLATALAFSMRGHHPDDNAHSGMNDRAQDVMPFDLSKTTHRFIKDTSGGDETVTANDAADTHQIDLIRSHLRYEAAEFSKGNYSDPAKIHGMDMPGLKELEAGAARVKVQYADLPTGAHIAYSSTDPTLVTALHDWFDRQTTDHDMPGMGG
jgi:hypothetical protein